MDKQQRKGQLNCMIPPGFAFRDPHGQIDELGRDILKPGSKLLIFNLNQRKE